MVLYCSSSKSNTIKNSYKNLSRPFQVRILVIVSLTLATLVLVVLFLINSLSLSRDQTRTSNRVSSHVPPSPSLPRSFFNNACSKTLHPPLCLTTLSSVPHSNSTTLHHVLEITINQTIKSVENSRLVIKSLLARQDLSSQEMNGLNDCREMLDQTLYELGQAIDDLQDSPASIGVLRRSYGNLKTLLSAAMTNENTCIGGFSDLEEADDSANQDEVSVPVPVPVPVCLQQHLRDLLAPISRQISNSLAMIKYMETINLQETINDQYTWTRTKTRNLVEEDEAALAMMPDIIVAKDGSGHFQTISEGVRMAPNMSMTRYVIKIRAGVYNESVLISREKTNVMLVGDGMSSTVIVGSKNLADGFLPFTSATLTVVGDNFLARDLTIINTAGPHKFQAVAARVTSNAAFYHCNFSSYQDTLYAHSLRQLYSHCTIQGTVDFIFGNAAAVFENCHIQVRKPILGQKNMITAQGREDPNQNTGFSFQNCTISAATDFTVSDRNNFSTFLGRPWRNYSRTVIMKSYLGDLIHPQGWCKWNEYSSVNTVEYIEHQNHGPGSDTRYRITWGGYKQNCSEDMANQFTVKTFLSEAPDNWLESTGFPLSSDS